MTCAYPELVDAQIGEFQREGFLRLGCILAEPDRHALAAAYDAIVDRARELRIGKDCADACVADGYVWIHSPELGVPALVEHPLLAYARNLAARLLGSPDKLRSGFRIFHKPAGLGRPTPLHQDEAYRNPEYSWQGVSVWTTLDPATDASGAMRFVAGSHRGELLPHHPVVERESAGLALEVNGADRMTPITVAAGAGDATVHHIRTIHGTHANRSAFSRRAIVAVCDAPGPQHAHRAGAYAFDQKKWFR